MKYNCHQCDSYFTTNQYLTKHNEYKHERVKHNCHQCDSYFTTKQYLAEHNEYKHEKVKYNCHQCYSYFTTKQYLTEHNEYKHEKVKYATHKDEERVSSNPITTFYPENDCKPCQQILIEMENMIKHNNKVPGSARSVRAQDFNIINGGSDHYFRDILLRNVSSSRQKAKQIPPLSSENGNDKTHFIYNAVQLYTNFDPDITNAETYEKYKKYAKIFISNKLKLYHLKQKIPTHTDNYKIIFSQNITELDSCNGEAAHSTAFAYRNPVNRFDLIRRDMALLIHTLQ